MVKFLNEKTFKCKQCGQCCRPVVKLSVKDIKRIEKIGMNKEEFLDFDPNKPEKKDTIKRIKGVCMFLCRKGEKYSCKIYSARPEVCRKYPFFPGVEKLEDCQPRRWKYWMNLKELVK